MTQLDRPEVKIDQLEQTNIQQAQSLVDFRRKWEQAQEENGTLTGYLTRTQTEVASLHEQIAELKAANEATETERQTLALKLSEDTENRKTGEVPANLLADHSYLMSLGFKDPLRAVKEGRLKVVPAKQSAPADKGAELRQKHRPSMAITQSQFESSSFMQRNNFEQGDRDIRFIVVPDSISKSRR